MRSGSAARVVVGCRARGAPVSPRGARRCRRWRSWCRGEGRRGWRGPPAGGTGGAGRPGPRPLPPPPGGIPAPAPPPVATGGPRGGGIARRGHTRVRGYCNVMLRNFMHTTSLELYAPSRLIIRGYERTLVDRGEGALTGPECPAPRFPDPDPGGRWARGRHGGGATIER